MDQIPEQVHQNNLPKIIIISCVIFSLSIITAVAGYFVGSKTSKPKDKVVVSNTPTSTSQPVITEEESVKQLITETTKIQSYWYSPDKKWLMVLARKDFPEILTSSVEYSELVIETSLNSINIDKKEKQEISLSKLIHPRITEIWQSEPVQHYSYFNYLTWTTNLDFWGTIEITDPGDPPIPSQVTVFKFNPVKNSIDIFGIPSEGSVRTIKLSDLNINKNLLLIETYKGLDSGGQLYLYLYSLYDKKKYLITSYSSDTLNQIFQNNYPMLSYFNPTLMKVESRQLNPKWDGSGNIVYRDFVTGNLVTVDITNILPAQ